MISLLRLFRRRAREREPRLVQVHWSAERLPRSVAAGLADPPVYKDPDMGVSPEEYADLSVAEAERYHVYVGLLMDTGWPRGYSERTALGVVLEDRSSSGLGNGPREG